MAYLFLHNELDYLNDGGHPVDPVRVKEHAKQNGLIHYYTRVGNDLMCDLVEGGQYLEVLNPSKHSVNFVNSHLNNTGSPSSNQGMFRCPTLGALSEGALIVKFKPDSLPSDVELVFCHADVSNARVYLGMQNGSMYYRLGSGSATTIGTITTSWNWIGLTFNNGTVQPYINGLPVGSSQPYSGTVGSNQANSTHIGQFFNNGVNSPWSPYKGEVAFVQVFNKEQSSQEMRNLYLNPSKDLESIALNPILPFPLSGDKEINGAAAQITYTGFAPVIEEVETSDYEQVLENQKRLLIALDAHPTIKNTYSNDGTTITNSEFTLTKVDNGDGTFTIVES